MRTLVERAIDLWTFGVPVIVMVWSLLRLFPRAAARRRYVLVVGGFVLALALPLVTRLTPESPIALQQSAQAVLPTADLFVPLLWVTGALLLLTRDAFAHLRLRLERRSWPDAPAELRSALDWPEGVPLVIGAGTPMTVGLLRPAVALPEQFMEQFQMATVKGIGLHELSHARWFDPLVYAALRATAALLWPSPLWLLLRWIRREREAAADEAALRGADGDGGDYVAALLHLSRSRALHRSFAPGMAESDLAYRARRILAPPPARVSIAAMLLLLAGGVMASQARPMDLRRRESIPARADVRSTVTRRIEEIRPLPVRVVVPAAEAAREAMPRRMRSRRDPPRSVEEAAGQRIESIVDEHVTVHRHVSVHIDR